MGYYIDPIDGQDKGLWLEANGIRLSSKPNEYTRINDAGVQYHAVCLVDNGWMTAAGICYDKRELEAFTRPEDLRPKWWYMVPTEKLRMFCNVL